MGKFAVPRDFGRLPPLHYRRHVATRRLEIDAVAAAAPGVDREVIAAARDRLAENSAAYSLLRGRERLAELKDAAVALDAALEGAAADIEERCPDPVPRAVRTLGGQRGHWHPTAWGGEWIPRHRARCESCLGAAYRR